MGGRFLLLDGWRCPVANDSTDLKSVPMGDVDPSFTFRPNRTRRSLPMGITQRTTAMLRTDADTLEGLINGRAHHFPCDVDAWSTSGIGPELGSDYEILARSQSAAMFGRGYLHVITSATWNPQLPAKWTVMFWAGADDYSTAHHYVLRSDGVAYKDGAVFVGVVPSLVVDDGAFAFGAGNFDDIVALPFIASADFLVAFYRWTTGKGLVLHLPFDRFVDDAQDRGLSASEPGSAVTYRVPSGFEVADPGGGGRVGLAAGTFNGTQRVALVDARLDLLASAYAEVSWEAWVRWDSTLTPGAQAYIVHKDSGGGAGYRIWVTAGGVIHAEVGLAGSDASAVTGAVIEQDQLHHVAVTFTQASGELTVYVDGEAVALASSVANPAAAYEDDGGDVVTIGNNTAGNRPFGGVIDDFRFYRMALSAAEVADHYECGLWAQPVPGWMPFSANPIAWGSSTDWRAIEVVGESTDQQIVTHSRDGSWRNNSRTVSFSMAQRRDFDGRFIPTPTFQWTLIERYLDDDGNFRPSHGAFIGDRSGGLFVVGPVGARAWAAGDEGAVQLSDAVNQALNGRRGATVLAWVRRNVTGVQHTVIALTNAPARVRLRLDVTAGNAVRMAGISEGGVDVEQVQTFGALTDELWHLVGGVLDLPANSVTAVLDAGHATGAVTFASDVFVPDTGDVHFIAQDHTPANHWDGDIAVVSLWDRALTLKEIAAVYRLGRAGYFR